MIRILIDEGISRAVARDLRAQGYDVVHAIDLGLKSQDDPIIFREAQARQAAICALNRDDYALLGLAWQAWGLGPHHGIITPHQGPQPSNAHILAALRVLLANGTPLMDALIFL